MTVRPIWDAADGMSSLNDAFAQTILGPKWNPANWWLAEGHGINSSGDIAGIGRYNDGSIEYTHAFLLQSQSAVVREPPAVGLGVLGFRLVGWVRRKKRLGRV